MRKSGLLLLSAVLFPSPHIADDDLHGNIPAENKLRGHRDWFEPVLSHTFASRLVMAGVDLRTVAQLMGHRTNQMTMRYAHLAPDHQQSAVERIVGKHGRKRSATKTATGKLRKAATAGRK